MALLHPNFQRTDIRSVRKFIMTNVETYKLMLFGAFAQNVRFVCVWAFGLKFVLDKLIFESTHPPCILTGAKHPASCVARDQPDAKCRLVGAPVQLHPLVVTAR